MIARLADLNDDEFVNLKAKLIIVQTLVAITVLVDLQKVNLPESHEFTDAG
jgi:hypothetical protein